MSEYIPVAEASVTLQIRAFNLKSHQKIVSTLVTLLHTATEQQDQCELAREKPQRQ
jgi:hypothetical protein